MKYISLFAGMGGFDIAMKKNGFHCVFSNDILSASEEVFHKNFPNNNFHLGDINDFSVKKIPSFDLLAGGFPCQPFSIAGQRKGITDSRGKLIYKVFEIIKYHKPAVVFLENVKGLISVNKGKDIKKIISMFSKNGYFLKYKVINSKDFGVSQNRERVFFVAFKSKIHFEKFEWPKKQPIQKNLFETISLNKVDDYYYLSDKLKIWNKIDINSINKGSIYQIRRIYLRENKSGLCPTLTANMGTGGHNVPIIKDDFGIRKITINEALKFQGFPNSFKFPSTFSQSLKYFLIGNSVTVNVIDSIAKQIKEATK